jgi:hypothetical protein
MKFSVLLFALAITATVAEPLDGDKPAQSQASFEAAIHNHSTAPSYVLITVVDSRSKSVRTTCTTANLLMGAIHREFGLEYDKASQAKAEEIALANKTHVFHLAKREALKNIPYSFSQSDLEAVRAKLASLSIAQLRDGFANTGSLHSIYRVEPWERHQAYRDATACVLIERGLSPGMGDRTDHIWLAP